MRTGMSDNFSLSDVLPHFLGKSENKDSSYSADLELSQQVKNMTDNYRVIC